MKTNIYISKIILAGLFCAAISMSSCKKFVETEPYSYFTSANFFSNEDEAYLATLGIYEVMSRPQTYGQSIPMLYDNDTDISQMDAAITADAFRAIPHYYGTAETDNFYQTWSSLYTGIDRANVVIEKIPEMPTYSSGTQAQKDNLNRMLGEAKFLRGFYFSELVRFWGDVPFKLTSSKAGENFKVERTDRYVIYEQIFKDMREAAALLPDKLPTDERINKWAAKAMLARVALMAGGYSLRQTALMERPANYIDYYKIAQQEINDVINSKLYKLNDDFTKLFKNQCQFILEPTENMFEVAFFSNLGNSSENSLGGNFLSVTTAQGVYNASLGRGRALRLFYNSFNPKDIRRDFSIATFRIDATGQKVQLFTARLDEQWTSAKWSREYQTDAVTERNTTSINTVILRYADVLLMRAEVENEINNGPNSLAYEAINEVRRRGFGLNASGSQVSITLNNAGTGYTSMPVVTVTGGGGSGAAAGVTTLASGRITGFVTLSAGWNYTSAPTVTITGGGGTGATATAALVPKATADQVNLAGLTKDQFFDAVQKERAFELNFEGTRRTDLIRWNILAARIKKTADDLRAYRANYAYPAGTFFRTGQHELYPIPLNETDVNKIVGQNPNY
ncbi:RagB/SusD family nutrient uptake outer membrane protein [Pedobacter heparinus]|uniref:RagB/SusD domain protein n=1 Tax=Pedobacter heparinus (strain ATCC 13125 / DSM 2366 / CIP 104194 / JCM 7457 / NBRC 12017 / NCIMB 9290 / NRRL B-14731 / HIM 762-3) TaxID=485917 RepID=C6Y1Q0_PEDHD|nr:RagB/SusD family nutrient uptake outer membrane protein [Pedobacter heparinus]ACU05042.1 RagB/SusD domain protein [Pedobacter heparinus DSM 2366]